MARKKNSKTVPRKGPTLWQRFVTFIGICMTLVLLAALGVVGYVDWLFYQTGKDMPTADKLLEYVPSGITEIYATDKDPKTGRNVLLARLFTLNKQFAPIAQINPMLQKATIAIEDERFYDHTGIDPQAIVRAVYKDIRGGRLEEGGSTLTQQLARNVYLTQTKTFGRKAKEILIAIQLEKNFAKEQILEMYLNEVYYGSNAYGVQAAAQEYFGKKLKDLSLAQCALLAGLPQSPNKLQPRDNPEGAKERRNTVLFKMHELGFIDGKQYEIAKATPVRVVAPVQRNQSNVKAPYFVEYIRSLLIEKHGRDKVYNSGLKVYTTLNWKMQQEAERALINGVMQARGERVTEGAIVSIEPRSGYIRAMVGGVDFKNNQYNNVVQGRRQPGSSFKPFVYTTAFETHRYDANSSINDNPQSFPDGSGRRYRPKNYGGNFHGWVSVREAVIHSYNVAAVSLCSKIGPGNVITTARKMGIKSPLSPTLALALGSYEVTPLEIASAYSTFPNSGSHAHSMGIIRVVDGDGYVLENNAPVVDKAVVSEFATAEMSDILADVVLRGTAAGAKGIHEVENAHGKTGTTNDNRDAWFVGYTPELSTAVWVCGVQRKPNKPIQYAEMDQVTGGAVCAPIWARFMKAAVPIQRSSGLPQIPPPRRMTDALTQKPIPETDSQPAVQDTPVLNRASRTAAAAVKSAMSAVAALAPMTPSRPAAAPVVSAAKSPIQTAPIAALTTNATLLPRVSPVAPRIVSIAPRITSPPTTPLRATPTDAPRSAQSPRTNTFVVKPRPVIRQITVEICADSGLRATRWCPETVNRTFEAGRTPSRYCRQHRPAPGEGN